MFKWMKNHDHIWLSGWFGGATVGGLAARFYGPPRTWELILVVCGWFLFSIVLTEKK